eukprot:gene1147-1312_t
MKFTITLLLSLCLVASIRAQAQPTTCRAVSFSGAGDRGAYEAGVVWGLVDSRPSEEVAWQFSSGISAGSINAGAFAMYGVGDEHAAADFLVSRWLSISQEQVFVDWEGGVADGLLFRTGLYDTRPLYKFLSDNVNWSGLQASTRGLYIGATCLDNGLFTPFNKTDPEIVKGILASCSIPLVFPPTEKDGFSYVDGGATYSTPITDTARLCYATGATDVIIDVVLGIGSPLAFFNVSGEKTIKLLERSVDIIRHNGANKDIETVFQAFPNAKLNLYYPSQPLPGNMLGFQYSGVMVSIGYSDATSENSMFSLTKNDYEKIVKMGKPLF